MRRRQTSGGTWTRLNPDGMLAGASEGADVALRSDNGACETSGDLIINMVT